MHTSFPEISLPHGYTTKVLTTYAEKAAEHAKLLSGSVGWANQDFVAFYQPTGELSAIIIANHSEKQVFRITSERYKPLAATAQDAVSAFLVRLNYRLTGVLNKALDKPILGADGRFYALDDLPDELHVRGDLYLPIHKGGPIKFPRRRLIVDGDLDPYEHAIAVFPSEYLWVKGDLRLSKSNVTALPKRLRVDGDFGPARDTLELPVGTRVGRTISLSYTAIARLPRWMRSKELWLNVAQADQLPLLLSPLTKITVRVDDNRGNVQTLFAMHQLRRLLRRPAIWSSAADNRVQP